MKNTTKENLKLWRSVCVTNPEWIKSANLGGRKISAINPQKQMKQASELWGSYGSVWGLKDCKRNILDLEQSNKLIILEAVFFYPSGSFEISNSTKLCYMSKGGKYIIDDEAFKKVETNTLSKALSKLGFSSDVYEGQFDKQGYEKIADYATDTELPEAEIQAAKKAIKKAASVLDISKLWAGRKAWHENTELIEIYRNNLTTLQNLEQ